MRRFWPSPIARLILASNLAGLIVIVIGALVLNELRSGLVQARVESLRSQGELVGSVISQEATRGEPQPALLESRARSLLKRLKAPRDSRVRLYGENGQIVADSYLLYDEIAGAVLPPVIQPGSVDEASLKLSRWLSSLLDQVAPGEDETAPALSLIDEVNRALEGEIASSQRFGDNGQRVISVSVPIRHVGRVVGVLTIESSDVAGIIRAERQALMPFIAVAVAVSIATATALFFFIARPLRRLATAADRVRTGASDQLELPPTLRRRKDEIGDLGKALDDMTSALSDRIEANERFAADVAHELKNPLTSIRSAVETAQTVHDPAVRDRMREVIARDVIRLDRLITDISNLSRLEGEIVREKRTRVDLDRLLEDIVSIYRDTRREHEPYVTLSSVPATAPHAVMGREGPLSQVVRNLVENARSFSPPDGRVRVSLERAGAGANSRIRMMVEDDGPGVPEDKLEKIFERFYSDRPEGAKFGNNSGLGLSIVKQIIETHRGRVWAENRREGQKVAGARFIVELPTAHLEAERA